MSGQDPCFVLVGLVRPGAAVYQPRWERTPPRRQEGILGFGFWVLGFGFTVLGLGFKVWGRNPEPRGQNPELRTKNSEHLDFCFSFVKHVFFGCELHASYG